MKRVLFIFPIMILAAGFAAFAAPSVPARGAPAATPGQRTNQSNTSGPAAHAVASGRAPGATAGGSAAPARGGTGVQTRSATTSARAAGVQTGRSATVSARSGTTPTGTTVAARSGATPAVAARAAATFTDMSKMGGAYAQCRDQYFTCMDQFCTDANNAAGRCMCNDKVKEFGTRNNQYDRAISLLNDFKDSNLSVVGLTGAEVTAMNTATEGELANKRKDTTAAAKMLDEISAILSGKSLPVAEAPRRLDLSGMLDFNSSIGDIWEGGAFGDNSGDIWSRGNRATNLSGMEGLALYNEVDKQCAEMSRPTCEAPATQQMVRSAYTMLISQECGEFERKLDKKRAQVSEMVREAGRVLRDARLEEYRAHNSDSVNACVANVRAAMQHESVCGADWRRCLDFSGRFINPLDGEPILTPELFELTNTIDLVPGASNATFVAELEKRKIYANEALDTCRSVADFAWNAFKDQAIIEISQAQDRKIESVKDNCMSVVKQCYDARGGDIRDFDDTTAQMAGALSARAAKALCEDKVAACANLYSDLCVDASTGGGVGARTSKATVQFGTRQISQCGKTALLSFVDAVDDMRIQEGCQTALQNYLTINCAVGDMEYPLGCVNKEWDSNVAARLVETQIKPNYISSVLAGQARLYCKDPLSGTMPDNVRDTILPTLLNNLKMEMGESLRGICETEGGYWTAATGKSHLTSFVTVVFGAGNKNNTTWGVCTENTGARACAFHNVATDGKDYAKWDGNQCVFSPQFAKARCLSLTGVSAGWDDTRKECVIAR